MSVHVNGVEITDAQIDEEIRHHERAARPMDEALRALVIQRVVLDEAERCGFDISHPDAAATALLEQQVHCPTASEEDCLRHYQANPERFKVGALVSASHILFQVTPEVNLDRLRDKATEVLQLVQAQPERFAEFAKEFSNCTSSALGGGLGQLSRGDSVPEFDRALFSTMQPGVLDRLVQTRFGFHIVRIDQCIEGNLLPFEHVRQQIAHALHAATLDRATQQYLKVLVGRAKIVGVDMEAENGLLVQ